jgi:hypothetical protein
MLPFATREVERPFQPPMAAVAQDLAIVRPRYEIGVGWRAGDELGTSFDVNGMSTSARNQPQPASPKTASISVIGG